MRMDVRARDIALNDREIGVFRRYVLCLLLMNACVLLLLSGQRKSGRAALDDH